MPVSFLGTRVSKSTENVWLKLRRLLKFLSQTIDESLILRVENFSHSFAVHGDMKSHAEGDTLHCTNKAQSQAKNGISILIKSSYVSFLVSSKMIEILAR